jgi:sigma-E factor negative regulatory protein RseC
MTKPEATVVATGAGFATVSVKAAVACPRCAAGRGCGAGLLQKGRTRVMQVRVAAGLELEVGDQVSLELAPERLLRAAWLAYGLPLSAMVLGVAVATAALHPGNDFALVAFAAVGLAAGVFAGRSRLARDHCMRRITPVVRERIGSRTCEQGGTPSDTPVAGS